MRVGHLLFALLVAAVLFISGSWITYKHHIVVHQRAAAEWTALSLMDKALANGQRPTNADAAVFLSNGALEQALKQLVGATIKPTAAQGGDLTVTITDVRSRPAVGLTGVALSIDVASAQRGLAVRMGVEGALAFRGIETRSVDGARPVTTADFTVSVVKAEPKLKWGFLDLEGRHFVSEAIPSGLMLALDHHLAVSIPFEDRLAFDTGFSSDSVVRTGAGSVTLNASLPGKILEQRFSLATPLFLRSGVWLLAGTSATGQVSVTAPAVPAVSPPELEANVETLRAAVATTTQGMEQTHDVVLWVKGSMLIGLVDQLRSLPQENRTVTIQSVATTGQLVSDGKSYAELPNPGAATARLVINSPTAQWVANKGAALSLDLNMSLNASVRAHINPLPVGGGAGTVFGLEGGTSKHIAGTLQLTRSTIAGHSVLLLGSTMPCDSVTADVKTDGKIVIGPLRTDLFGVGLRWTMPIPQTLGQPTLVLDDLPRRFALSFREPGKDGVSVKPAHGAVEFATHITSANATETGYLVAADLDMRAADGLAPSADYSVQKSAIAKGLDAVRQAAAACPAVQPNMSVLIGDLQIDGNGEIAKALRNLVNDVTQGPGDSNDLVGKDGFVARKLDDARKDLTQGPGDSNDLVGKKGAVRSNLRNIPVIGGLF